MTNSQQQVSTTEKSISQREIEDSITRESLESNSRTSLGELQRDSIIDLMERQREIVERYEALGRISDESERMKQQAILEAESIKLTQSIEQREKQVGELAYGLLALHNDLGVETKQKKEYTAEDLTLISGAENALQEAQKHLGKINEKLEEARSAKAAAETEKASLESGFFSFMHGRAIEAEEAKIADANRIIDAAPEAIQSANDRIAEAEKGLVEAKAQAKINVAERVKEASLQESFTTLRTLSKAAVEQFQAESKSTAERLAASKTAYNTALRRKSEVAVEKLEMERKLDGVNQTLAIQNQTLGEIMDTSSPEFSQQKMVISGFEEEKREIESQLQKANGEFISLEAATVAIKAQIDGLSVQMTTADMLAIKVENSEKTARVVASGIDQMVKNSQNEAVVDMVDRANDQTLYESVALAHEAGVASAKAANDAYERHVKQMERLSQLDETARQGMAQQHARYAEIDKQIRARYEEAGIDVSGSYMASLAEDIIEDQKINGDQVTF